MTTDITARGTALQTFQSSDDAVTQLWHHASYSLRNTQALAAESDLHSGRGIKPRPVHGKMLASLVYIILSSHYWDAAEQTSSSKARRLTNKTRLGKVGMLGIMHEKTRVGANFRKIIITATERTISLRSLRLHPTLSTCGGRHEPGDGLNLSAVKRPCIVLPIKVDSFFSET